MVNIMKSLNLEKFNPNIRNYIQMLQQICNAPTEIVFPAVMSVISTAVQGVVNLKLHGDDEHTTALAFIVIADSGMRKSSTWSTVVTILQEFQDEVNKDFEAQKANYESEKKGITKLVKSLEKKYQKLISSNPCEKDSKKILEEIDELKAITKPERYRLIVNDSSTRAIDQILTKNPSILYGSHEASFIFSRQGQRFTSMFTQLWDGYTYFVDRRNHDTEVVQNPRVTMLLMMQKNIFRSQFKYGNSTDELGLLARFFIAYADRASLPQNTSTPPESALMGKIQFKNSIQKLLTKQRHLQINQSNKPCLEVSDDGRSYLLQAVDYYRNQCTNYGRLANSNAMIEKFYELNARMAACIHVFNDPDLESKIISLETIKEALSMTQQYLELHQSLLGEGGKMTSAYELKEILKEWFIKNIYKKGDPFQFEVDGHFFIKKEDILRYGPYSLRNIQNLNPTLFLLKSENIIIERIWENESEWIISRDWIAELKGIDDAFKGLRTEIYQPSPCYIKRPPYQRKDKTPTEPLPASPGNAIRRNLHR